MSTKITEENVVESSFESIDGKNLPELTKEQIEENHKIFDEVVTLLEKVHHHKDVGVMFIAKSPTGETRTLENGDTEHAALLSAAILCTDIMAYDMFEQQFRNSSKIDNGRGVELAKAIVASLSCFLTANAEVAFLVECADLAKQKTVEALMDLAKMKK